MITRAVIKNYKGLRESDIQFGPDLNILVGDNETGKSTVLEAINLALTGQINRRSAKYELHPFLFHQQATAAYIAGLQEDPATQPPEILIEVYLQDVDQYADLKGQNNSLFENCPGVKLRIGLDDRFSDEYAACIAQKERITMVPTEYFGIFWECFGNNKIDLRSMPVRPVLIDPGSITSGYAASRYVVEIARDFLTPQQQADLALSYRSMRDVFKDDASVLAINEKLEEEKGVVTDRSLSVALDMTAKANWETSVQPHLDDLPLTQIGKGEQNAIKIKLALKSNEDRQIVLIEEPENHLSHTNLGKLIADIQKRAAGRQLIITTHSSFVLNKLGVEHALMFNGSVAASLNDLSPGTTDYFIKLPGHDTLRMVLAERTILVEGPSDELVVQKAYQQVHGRLPLEDGVEVVAVNSLAFKRFLEIAKLLALNVTVVTDNDSNPAAVEAKYADFAQTPTIQINFSDDPELPTLERQLLAVNSRESLNEMLGRADADDPTLLAWMDDNKTETAMRIFKSEQQLVLPQYIADAVA